MQTLSISGSITPGPISAITLAESLSVSAIGVVHHVAEAAASKIEVDLAAVSDKDDIEFVLIYADSYPETAPGTPDVSYHVHANTETEVPLSMFHMYMPFQCDALDTAGLAFDKIFVSNGSITDVNMVIVVGWTPTP